MSVQSVKITVHLLESLGFIINKSKSNLIPSQICTFLGFSFNSRNMTLELTQDKKTSIAAFISKIKSLKLCKIRYFSKFIGTLVSACPAVKYGRAHTKSFERARYLALIVSRQNYDKVFKIPGEIKKDLDWWSNNILNSKNEIKQDSFSLEIYCDASSTGWGAYSQGETTSGWWSKADSSKHINYLELLAVFYSLNCFAQHLKSTKILVRVDNTTTLAYINKMGGVRYPELSTLARLIWQWCEERDIWLLVSYVKSDKNKSDQPFRLISLETEWELSKQAFNDIIKHFGCPEVDLFASHANHKCLKYFSWFRDPFSLGVDAFTVCWSKLFFYAFPPFSLITRVLKKNIN